jgi:hypothetical protein
VTGVGISDARTRTLLAEALPVPTTAAGVLETRPSMGRGARAAAISMDASKAVAQCGQLGLGVAARYSRAGRSPPPPEGGSEEAEESFGGQEEIRVGGISEPGHVADSGQHTY